MCAEDSFCFENWLIPRSLDTAGTEQFSKSEYYPQIDCKTKLLQSCNEVLHSATRYYRYLM